MQFLIEVKKFLDLLTIMVSILDTFGKTGQNLAIACNKKTPLLLGSVGPTQVAFDLSSAITLKAKGQFSFGFDPKILIPALSKRAQLEAEYRKSMLSFESKGKGSKYKGEVVTLPVHESLEAVAKAMSVERNGIALSKDALDAILQGAKLTKLNPIHNSEKDILTNIRARDGHLVMSSADNYHSSLFTTGKIKKLSNFHAAFPSSYFDFIAKVRTTFEDAAHSLTISEKTVTLYSDNYVVRLPAVQVEASTFDRVEQLFAGKGVNNPVLTFDLEHEKLDAAVANFQSIIEAGALIEIENPNNKCVRLQLTSNYGSLSDSLKVENLENKKFKQARIDPDALLDSMSALGGVISFSVVKEPKAFVLTHNVKDVGLVRHLGMQL